MTSKKKKTKKRDQNMIPLRLLKKHPDTKVEEWERVGEGWRHNTAKINGTWIRVGENTTIGPDSTIGEGCSFGEGVRIMHDVTIGNECLIEDSTSVGPGTVIEDRSTIFGYCRIGSDVRIGRRVKIGYDVTLGHSVCVPVGRISDKAKFTSNPLVIHGSTFAVVHSGPRLISIGCKIHTIGWWQKYGRNVGGSHSWNEEDMAEYELYINLVAARDAVVFPGKKFDREDE